MREYRRNTCKGIVGRHTACYWCSGSRLWVQQIVVAKWYFVFIASCGPKGSRHVAVGGKESRQNPQAADLQ